MLRHRGISIQWMMIAGLVGILALGGCSRKNVIATTTGAEGQEAAKTKSGGAGDRVAKSGGGSSEGSGGAGDEGRGRARAGEGETGASAREKSSEGSGIGPSGFKSRPDAGAGELERSGESLGPIGSGPLQGFKKERGEERLGDAPPMMVAKAAPQDLESSKTRDGRRRQLADIYFEFDKWALSNEGKKNLAESADLIKQNPGAKLVIEGHCDERGSREYNLVLGEKRAKEASRYLADLGIRNPVSVTSFGKERPVCTERDESCYWKNRRAHLLIDEGK